MESEHVDLISPKNGRTKMFEVRVGKSASLYTSLKNPDFSDALCMRLFISI
jgi:hypothetical protein